MSNTIINGGASPYPKHVGPAPICSFSDGAQDAPLKSLKFYIEPQQDLHGYDYPWPGGGGLNRLPSPATATQTNNGITISVDNGVYSISGTASASAEIIFDFPSSVTYDNTYKCAWLNDAVNAGVTVYWRNNYTNGSSMGFGGGTNRVAEYSSSGTFNKVRFLVSSGTAITGTLKCSPVLCLKTDTTPTSFSPYSNICPISGWSQVDAVAAGANLLDTTKTYQQGANQLAIGQDTAITTYGTFLKAGTYKVSVQSSKLATIYVATAEKPGGTNIGNTSEERTLTLAKDSNVCVFLYTSSGISAAEVTSYILSPTSTAYAPYSGTPITISLGQTVYGGTADALAGSGTSKLAFGSKDLSTVTFTNGTNTKYATISVFPANVKGGNVGAGNPNYMCNMIGTYAYNTGDTVHWYAVNNSTQVRISLPKSLDVTGLTLQVTAELAEETAFSTTPVSVSSLLGQNNVWASTGDTELDYYPAAASVVAVLNRSSKVYTSIPLGKIRYDTYQTTPNQALDLDSYRAETGVLIRNVLSHTATKIEFNTPSMTNAQWEEVWNIIKAGFNNSTERKLKLKYYDQMSATYKTGWFYVPDVQFTIRNIDEAAGIINYDEVRVAFIEY